MAYSGSFAITSISGDAVTEADVFFVGRDSDTGLGSVIIAGTYTGDVPSSMKGKCGSGAYVTLTLFTASGGVWSGRLSSIVAGTSLSLVAMNAAAESSSALVMTDFGCGDYGIVAGQSNAKGQIVTNFNGSTDPLPAAHIEGATMFVFNTTSQLFELAVPGVDYHMARAFSILSRKTGIPICIVNAAIGGTSIASWLYPSGASWLSATTNLTRSNVIGSGNSPYVLWWQGEANSSMAGTVYANYLLQIVSDMRQQWGINEVLAVPLPFAASAAIAEGIIDIAIGGQTYLFPACGASDIRYDSPDYGDDTHVKRVQEATIIGDRIGQTLIWRAGYTSPSIGTETIADSVVKYAPRLES